MGNGGHWSAHARSHHGRTTARVSFLSLLPALSRPHRLGRLAGHCCPPSIPHLSFYQQSSPTPQFAFRLTKYPHINQFALNLIFNFQLSNLQTFATFQPTQKWNGAPLQIRSLVFLGSAFRGDKMDTAIRSNRGNSQFQLLNKIHSMLNSSLIKV